MKSDNGHIDVLLLAQHDWANTLWRFTKCLEMNGLKVVAFKGEEHIYEYPEQIEIHPALKDRKDSYYHYIPELKPYADRAKVLYFGASTFIDTGHDPFKKPVVMQHGGTIYRHFSDQLNSFFNHFVDATIIQCPDLLTLGAPNEHLIYYPVDIHGIQPRYERSNPDKIIIGHFPRNPEIKGTGTIMAALESLKGNPKYKDKFDYVHTTDLVSWKESLERMAACDVIIETCNPVQAGKTFGEWGNTALEAAALGKIIISNSLGVEVYKKEYKTLGLLVANDKPELEREIAKVLQWSEKALSVAKRLSRKWAENNHSMEATAKRLWNKIYKPLFEGGNNG